jgi:hypothetical protein
MALAALDLRRPCDLRSASFVSESLAYEIREPVIRDREPASRIG